MGALTMAEVTKATTVTDAATGIVNTIGVMTFENDQELAGLVRQMAETLQTQNDWSPVTGAALTTLVLSALAEGMHH